MMSLNVQTKSQEICRMSWFLIEMDEGQAKCGKTNGRIAYGIIHSIDLIDSDSTYMYLNRKVRFNWNHAIIEGRVKYASDDRSFIEQQFKVLTMNNKEAIVNPDFSKRFLVQYSRGANTIAHAIVHQKEVVWPKDAFENSIIREVLIRDGKIQRMATVLHVNDSEDIMEKQLNALKTKCFEESFLDTQDNNDIEQKPWLLVQYSSCPANISYSVVHLNSTVLQSENLYRNIVAYIKENDAYFQAIILRKSSDRNELDNELRLIKDSSLMTKFPIETCESNGNNGNNPKQFLITKLDLPPVNLQEIYGNSVKILTYTKFTVRTPILDKIDESSENSTSSIELGKKDLKVAATYLRLSAGCGIDTTKKKGEEEDDDNITKGEKKDTKNETKDGVILTKDAQKKSGLSSSPNAVKEVKQKNDERKEEKKDAQKGTRSLPKAVEKTKHKTVEKKSNQKDSLMNNDSQKRIGNKEKDQKQEINKEIEKDNIREIYKANKGCTLPKIVEGEEKTEKNIDLSDEMRYGCLLAPENKRNFEVASVSENKIILKVKNSNTKDKEHAVTTFSNGPTSTKPNEVITTSFIEKLVAETQTVSCSATKVKDLFPPCKMRETPSAQHDQADLKTKSNRGLSNIYCPSPSDKEMCIRIQNLESQVIQISAEMKDLQKELLPSDDVAKLNLITRRFDEVNNLLLELKFNCMELKRCQRQMLERGHLTYGSEDSDWYSTTDSDSNEEFCSSNAHFETYNGNIHQGDDCYGRRRPIPVRLSNIFHRSPRPSPAQSNTNNLQPNRTYSNIRHNQYFTGRNPFEPSRQRTAESKYPAAAYRTSLHNFNTNLQSLNFTYNEPNYRKRRLTDTQKVVDSKCVATDSVIPVNASYQPTAERPYQHSFGIATHNFTASSSKKYATNDTTNNNKSPSKEYVITSRNAAGTDTLENRLTPIVNEIESDYYINDCPTEVVKSNTYDELPLVTHNLSKAIWNVIGNTSCDNIALTIFIERNNLYHINISVIQTGQCLGCVYTNEVAFEQAKKQNLFSAFFVFLVLNSDNSLEERSKVLGYSFDFVNINN